MLDQAAMNAAIRSLTKTQFLVLRLSLRGESVKDVVAILARSGRAIAVRTVEVHREAVMDRVGVHPWQRLIPALWELGIARDLLDEAEKNSTEVLT